MYTLRLFKWQIIDGDKYLKVSDSSTSFFIKLNAARGEILDKNGKTLAGSRTTYNVVMNALTMANDRNLAIAECLSLMKENKIAWIDKLPITISVTGAYEFKKDSDSEIKYLKGDDMLGMQDYATADECMIALIDRYDCANYTREEARDIISVRYYMTKSSFNRSVPYIIARDVPIEFIQKISEKEITIPGIETRVSTERDYADGTTAPHIIGNLGSVTQEQYNSYVKNKNTYSSDNVSGYSYTETVGQSGIENVFESVLRGKNGKEIISTGNEGEVIKTEVSETPVAGNSVYLTIDSNLQRVANESLERNVKDAKTPDCTAGGVVVLDLESFGVLAASTYPNFDMAEYVKDDKYYYELLEDKAKPLFNRALNGVFTPGSVMKPAVGLAALEESVIDINSTVNCNGAYTYYENDPLDCLGVHGDANIISALQESCNTYFCDVGRLLGIDRMLVYSNLFSLGERTGIEISESAGSMSNREEYYQNHGVEWVDGITIQAAIGQADSMFTPIQLATYCATIATGGVRYKTHFLDKITDYDNQEVVKEYKPEIAETLDISQTNMKIIQEGMLAVTQGNGTASSMFEDYGIAVAAKTGTAENPNHSDNTVFMAYAPYNNPKIAVAVVIEYGSSGSLSMGVAKDIFDCYFFGKTLEQKEKDKNSGADNE